MIKCENLSGDDIKRIGAQIAKAFLSEPGAFAALPASDAEKLFSLIAETCFREGHLYTTSEKQEGFCVYWTKAERPGLLAQLRMVIKMAVNLPLKTALAVKNSQNDWKPTEKRYRKNDDFVEVFLIAVRKEYQGQGHFRRMLEEPFSLAKQRGTICVLDTDSQIKADKYAHEGMRTVESRIQKSGVTMFAMELQTTVSGS